MKEFWRCGQLGSHRFSVAEKQKLVTATGYKSLVEMVYQLKSFTINQNSKDNPKLYDLGL